MTPRTWEYIIFVSAFLIRLYLTKWEKRPYSYCGDAWTLYLQIGATVATLYLPICLVSILLSNFTDRVPQLRWTHPWVVGVRWFLYMLLSAALPGCFLSQLMLRFWRFK